MRLSKLLNSNVWMILFYTLIIAIPLNAERPTIIDTIWTENSLQGCIGYHVQNGTYYGGVLLPGTGAFGAGDSFDPYGDFNDICIRTYLSFPIQPIPENYVIDSVSFFAYQWSSMGNDLWGVPIWFDNQYYPCNLYHVDFGLSFEPDDFNPAIYDTIGALSTTETTEWKHINISNAYISDMQSNRPYCQLMIKFPIMTDYDQMIDGLMFTSSYGTSNKVHLIISYSSTNVNDEEVNAPDRLLSVYPNPCHMSISIKVQNRAQIGLVELYNIKGQRIKTNNFIKDNTYSAQIPIDKSVINSGIYILKTHFIYNNKKYALTKIISVL